MLVIMTANKYTSDLLSSAFPLTRLALSLTLSRATVPHFNRILLFEYYHETCEAGYDRRN